MPDRERLIKRLEHIQRRRPAPFAWDGNPQVHLPVPQRIVPLGADPPDNPPRRDAPVRLEAQAYSPYALVDTAINSFTDPNALSAAQLRAKRSMTRQLLRSMTSVPGRTHRKRNLYTFAKWADTLFFQRTLTGATPGHGFLPLGGIFSAMPAQDARGHFFIMEGINMRRRTIRVSEAQLRWQEDWAFEKGATLAGLLRVLTRMYLTLYGCVCDEHGCFRRIPVTYGITGQGYCWQVLMSTIILEIRSWDHRLRGFASHRAGRYGVDRDAAGREQRHWDTLTETGQWRGLVDGLDYPALGEHALQFLPDMRPVRRRGRNLRREAETLREEAVALLGNLDEFARVQRRQIRRPRRLGYN